MCSLYNQIAAEYFILIGHNHTTGGCISNHKCVIVPTITANSQGLVMKTLHII